MLYYKFKKFNEEFKEHVWNLSSMETEVCSRKEQDTAGIYQKQGIAAMKQ